MLLVIDNYDSFTYNLVQFFGQLGVEQAVYRNDAITVEEARALKPERIMISPGPCSPNEAGVSLEMIAAFAGKIPLLGVCLGHQALAVAWANMPFRPAVAPNVSCRTVSIRISLDVMTPFCERTRAR